MGQKVHPYGFRLGYTKPWKSRWFVERDYDKLLLEDVKLKNELKDKLKSAGVSSLEVERPGNKLRIIIKTARPGIIIGRKGAEIDKLKQEMQKRTSREVHIDIQEVHKPELDAQLVSESIALQLEKRVGFRRAMRKAVDSALRFGCKGIKVRVSGRLNGNEIARSEWYLQGRLPLHTLARRHRLRLLRSPHHLRGDRGEVLGLSRRNSAGQEARAADRRRVLKNYKRSSQSRRRTKADVYEIHYVNAQEGEVSETAARAHDRQGMARQHAGVRRFRIEGARAGMDHRPADRSQPRGHDPFREARRQDLDPAVSR